MEPTLRHSLRWVLGGLVALLALPAPAAACLCGEVLQPGQRSSMRPASERPVAFVGTALRVERRSESGSAGQPKQRVRFLVEAAWRGVESDTLTLAVYDSAFCADYMAGTRYLVFADLQPASVGGARTAKCDEGRLLHWIYPRGEIDELGPPSWVAQAPGSRRIDVDAVAVGTAIGSTVEAVGVGIGFMNKDDVARIEIADQVWTPASRSGVFHLPPGLYRARIEWTDGSTRTTYIDVFCPPVDSDRRCFSYHFLSGVRIDWPRPG